LLRRRRDHGLINRCGRRKSLGQRNATTAANKASEGDESQDQNVRASAHCCQALDWHRPAIIADQVTDSEP
jgi:hypothetical protein